MHLFMIYVPLCGSFHKAVSFAEHLHSLIIIIVIIIIIIIIIITKIATIEEKD